MSPSGDALDLLEGRHRARCLTRGMGLQAIYQAPRTAARHPRAPGVSLSSQGACHRAPPSGLDRGHHQISRARSKSRRGARRARAGFRQSSRRGRHSRTTPRPRAPAAPTRSPEDDALAGRRDSQKVVELLALVLFGSGFLEERVIEHRAGVSNLASDRRTRRTSRPLTKLPENMAVCHFSLVEAVGARRYGVRPY